MNHRRYEKAFLFASVSAVAVAFSLFLPFILILKILLIALLLLLLIHCVSEVDDRLDFHHIRQQWRRINLQRFKNLRPPYYHKW